MCLIMHHLRLTGPQQLYRLLRVDGPHGKKLKGGSEYIFYNDIIGRVRETQPQVVLSGEDCSGWDDAIDHNFQLPGTKASGAYIKGKNS